MIVLANNRDAKLDAFAADLAGTVVPQLALSPIDDAYPDLTADHRAFVQTILDGHVDPARLAPKLQADYEAKDHWSGIATMIQKDGGLLRFQPTGRRQTGPNAFESIYRAEGLDAIWRVELHWNGSGQITGFRVSG